jgi:hypothetical protein
MVRMGPRMGPALGPNRGVGSRVVRRPVGFGWTPPCNIIEAAPGVFTTDLDADALLVPTAVTRYVNVARPNNLGDGLSWANADKGIWACLSATATAGLASTIYILGSADPDNPTLYDWDQAWIGALTVDANILVVSDTTTLAPGYAVTSTGMPAGGSHLGAWALTDEPDCPDVYEATLATAPNTVIDATLINSHGAPTRLTNQASIALVQANPGSWHHASGVVYVQSADSRAPTSTLRVLRANATHVHVNGAAVNVYMRGLTIEGGNSARAVYMQAVESATFVDCTARCAQAAGFDLTTNTASATHTVIYVRCRALDNDADGFQYTASAASSTIRALEWDCFARGNSGAGTDQGSTAHFTAGNTAVSIVRVNGTFSSNKTQGIADVGDGIDSWNVGCGFTSEAIGFFLGDDSDAWLDGCTFTGCTTDLATDDAAGVINTTGTAYATTSGAGTVQRYHP